MAEGDDAFDRNMRWLDQSKIGRILTGAEAVAPIGGAGFHDNQVWIKRAASAV